MADQFLALLEAVPERIREKISFAPDCWEWIGAKTKTGYGYVAWPHWKQVQPAHRALYVMLRGAIPDGMEIDHLCRNRRCVNPEHLEAVTHHENLLRGDGIVGLAARQTHCKRGHEFTEENTYRNAMGERTCKVCRREYDRNRRKR